jgi:hypothetical protein
MRDLRTLDRFRIRGRKVIELFGSEGDGTCGAFNVPSSIDGGALRVIASSEGGWDHVSVSRVSRCPNWPEMEQIKRLFFKDHETAMQLHVPVSEHISHHPYCLHIWRPTDGREIPLPPAIFVAPKPD